MLDCDLVDDICLWNDRDFSGIPGTDPGNFAGERRNLGRRIGVSDHCSGGNSADHGL